MKTPNRLLRAALAGLLASCLALHWLIEEPARRWGRRMALRWEQPPQPLPTSAETDRGAKR